MRHYENIHFELDCLGHDGHRYVAVGTDLTDGRRHILHATSESELVPVHKLSKRHARLAEDAYMVDEIVPLVFRVKAEGQPRELYPPQRGLFLVTDEYPHTADDIVLRVHPSGQTVSSGFYATQIRPINDFSRWLVGRHGDFAAAGGLPGHSNLEDFARVVLPQDLMAVFEAAEEDTFITRIGGRTQALKVGGRLVCPVIAPDGLTAAVIDTLTNTVIVVDTE